MVKMKKFADKIVLIALLVLITGMDLIIKPNLISCITIAFLTSIAAFTLGMRGIRLGKYASILLLVLNAVFLVLTFNHRFYFFNIFLLSYILWQWGTPFLERFKNLLGLSVLTGFLAAYLIPLYTVKFPLLPFAMYPMFFAGYYIKNFKIEKHGKTLLLLTVSAFSSGMASAVMYFKLRTLSGPGILKFLSIPKAGSVVAVYLPFLTVFLVWFFLSICMAGNVLNKVYMSKNEGQEGFSEFFGRVTRSAFHFVSFFAVAGALLFVLEYILRGNVTQTLRIIIDPAAMFNLLCLCTVFLVLTAFMGRSLATTLLVLLTGVLALANFIKIRYFDEPFYPWDTYLIKEALTIAKGYVNLPLLTVVGVVLLAGVVCAFVFSKALRRLFKPRLVVAVLPFALVFLLINGIVINSTVKLDPLGIKKFWYIGKKEMQWNGVLVQNYFYLKEYDKYAFNKPEGYSKSAMEEVKKRLASSTDTAAVSTVKPNIVLIMCESFWDPTKFHDVNFSQDILKSFRPYQKGEMVSPAVGGGTANVEFEALTGLSNYFNGPGVLAYNVYFRRNTPSLISALKDNGYTALAIHPYKADMYNRNKVYKYLQFDQFIDETSFDPKTDLKGPYVSDEKLVDKISQILDEGDKPKFIFAVTMQNHDPYINKYKKPEVTVQSDKLSEKEASILSTYSVGIKDGSEALERLITNLSKSKKPTLVYFFGDHLPRLGSLQDMLDIYDRLNPETDAYKKDMRTYSTPYASWSNFKDTRKFETPVSPAHIAYEILKDSGVSYPSYFNVLKEVEKKYPYLQQSINGNVDANDQGIKDYRLIQYDVLFGNQYVWKK